MPSLPTPECFWGLDPHTRHFSIGIVGERLDNNVACWSSYATGTKTTSEAEMMSDLRKLLARELQRLTQAWTPTVIVVEQPVGKHPAPTLVGAWGIALAEVFDAVLCPIITLKPPEWKKEAGLPGNAGKSLILGQAIGELGYKGESEHEADALWMGVAARNLYNRRLNA